MDYHEALQMHGLMSICVFIADATADREIVKVIELVRLFLQMDCALKSLDVTFQRSCVCSDL